jgi:hypothetical protein
MAMLANLEAIEGSVANEITITLKRKSRKLVIINDAASKDLGFKFNQSEDFATLKGTEYVTTSITTNQIILTGDNVDYRIQVYG